MTFTPAFVYEISLGQFSSMGSLSSEDFEVSWFSPGLEVGDLARLSVT